MIFAALGMLAPHAVLLPDERAAFDPYRSCILAAADNLILKSEASAEDVFRASAHQCREKLPESLVGLDVLVSADVSHATRAEAEQDFATKRALAIDEIRDEVSARVLNGRASRKR